MKEKKSAVLTIRLSETTKRKLEDEAEERGWSPSKLAEKILSEYIDEDEKREREIEEENKAKEMLEYIEKSGCDNLIELTKWVIENNALETYNLSAAVWTEIIKEIKLDKEKKNELA